MSIQGALCAALTTRDESGGGGSILVTAVNGGVGGGWQMSGAGCRAGVRHCQLIDEYRSNKKLDLDDENRVA